MAIYADGKHNAEDISYNDTIVEIDFDLAEELLGTIAELDASGVDIPNFDELYNRLYDAMK